MRFRLYLVANDILGRSIFWGSGMISFTDIFCNAGGRFLSRVPLWEWLRCCGFSAVSRGVGSGRLAFAVVSFSRGRRIKLASQ